MSIATKSIENKHVSHSNPQIIYPKYIPKALQNLKQWILFRLEWDSAKKKYTKIPTRAIPGSNGALNASTKERRYFMSYDEALEYLDKAKAGTLEHPVHGVGFCLSGQYKIKAIDLDNAITPKGRPKKIAADIFKLFGGWVEKSQSGKGYHVFYMSSDKQEGASFKNHSKGVELFSGSGFIAMTGVQYGRRKTPKDIPASAEKVLREKYQTSNGTKREDVDVKGAPIDVDLRKLRLDPDDMRLIMGESSIEDTSQVAAMCATILADKGLDAQKIASVLSDECYPGASAKALANRGNRESAYQWAYQYQAVAAYEKANPKRKGNGAKPITKTQVGVKDHFPTPSPDIFHGVLGEWVDVLRGKTEAADIALIVQALVISGTAVGHTEKGPYIYLDGCRHHGVLFAVCVGATSAARKGTALSHAKNLFAPVLSTLEQRNGLSSGEGLIECVKDEENKFKQNTDVRLKEKAADRLPIKNNRLLIVETEFARVLSVMRREGCTLSAVLRDTWDGADLGVLTKAHVTAKDHHIGIIGHITEEELEARLRGVDISNGFANRFLWVIARRAMKIALPKPIAQKKLEPIKDRVTQAIIKARSYEEMIFTKEAAKIYTQFYMTLPEFPGIVGEMLGRAAPIAVRIACIYALLDASTKIDVPHIKAGIGLVHYMRDSLFYMFGAPRGDSEEVADRIEKALEEAEGQILTRTEISKHVFNKNKKSDEISNAIAYLVGLKIVEIVKIPTSGGRSKEVVKLVNAE